MNDLTILFLTANDLPAGWVAHHKRILLEAAGDFPIVTVSKKPINMPGLNLIDPLQGKSYVNLYRQLLVAAKAAETEFVAMAEDDVLYCPDHFRFHRPAADTFAYNQSRWSLYTWEPTTYSLKQRISNCTMIAPRKLLIDALEERFAKYPLDDDFPSEKWGECGRNRVERSMGVTLRKSEIVFSHVPVIHLNHPLANEDRQRRQRKQLGQIKAFDIPYWGKASDIVSFFR